MLDNVASLVAKGLQRVKKYSSIHLLHAHFSHNFSLDGDIRGAGRLCDPMKLISPLDAC